MKTMHRTLAAIGLMVGLVAATAAAQAPASQPAIPPAQTLITVHLTNSAPEVAAQELSTASGFNLVAQQQSQNAHSVTLNYDNQPFWVVMLDYLRQSAMQIQPGNYDDRTRINLMPGRENANPLPQFARGAFVFVSPGVARTHSIDYAAPIQKQVEFNLNVRAYVDPRLTVAAVGQRIELTEAIDDKGNSLLPEKFSQNMMTPVNFGNMYWYDISAPLKFISPDGGIAKSIKGVARFQLVTREELWQIAEMADAAGAEKTVPSGKYTIQSLSAQNANNYTLRVAIESDPAVARGGPPPMTDFSAIRRVLRVTDGLGRELSVRGYGTRVMQAGRRELNITFVLAGDAKDPNSLPARLEWRLPSEITDLAVPVEFSDLPIP